MTIAMDWEECLDIHIELNGDIRTGTFGMFLMEGIWVVEYKEPGLLI